MNPSKTRFSILIAFVVLAVPSMLRAQSETGSITGTIADASGALEMLHWCAVITRSMAGRYPRMVRAYSTLPAATLKLSTWLATLSAGLGPPTPAAETP